MLRLTREQAVRYRLAANNLAARLPAGAYVEAAFAGLQDTGPRDALLGLHARVAGCEPDAWAAPGLIQTYSPRAAVYVLPERDFGVFTVGRLPRDPDARRAIETAADQACTILQGRERGDPRLGISRAACATGRIAVRWTTSSLTLREVPRPDIDDEDARLELARRHLHAFAPTTAATFAWWAGLPPADARETIAKLGPELVTVELAGRSALALAADEEALRDAGPHRGVRLLVASDLRLLGQDRSGLYAGPGLARHSPLLDWFHPHGLLVDGAIAGTWGRRGGQVSIRTAGPLDPATRAAVLAEAATLPVPGATVTVDITEH